MYDVVSVIFGGLSWGAATFLVAAGLTLIFGILHILNFAHGGLFMIGAYLSYSMLRGVQGTVSFPLYIGAALVATIALGVFGVLIDMLIFRRLRNVDSSYALIATYALLLVCIGGVELVWGLDFISMMPPAGLDSALILSDVFLPTYTLFTIGAAVVVYLALQGFINLTSAGRLVRIVAADPWMARVLGVSVTRIYMLTAVIGFALAGLAGGLLSANQSISPELGGVFLLQAFGVVIVGGMGNITGAFIAAFLLGLIESAGSLLFPDYPGVFYLIAMGLLLLFRPEGIMGRTRHT